MQNLLLIVDDWEALERYQSELERTLGAHWKIWDAPLVSEALRLLQEQKFDAVWVDLAFEPVHWPEVIAGTKHLASIWIDPPASALTSDAEYPREVYRRPFDLGQAIRKIKARDDHPT